MSLIYSVEDDENIAELIRTALKTAGHEVESFGEYQPFSHEVKIKKPDLVLLDIMLPDKNGIEIITALKNDPATADIPVIFLSAKGSELDKVLGLENGAEDYISKPFGVLELLARVKAALRRTVKEEKADTDFSLNEDTREVICKGEKIKLTFIEFELLAYLYRNAGFALSRDKILTEVWGYDYEGDTTRTVDMHIRALRQKLKDNADAPKYIETVRGFGYRFVK